MNIIPRFHQTINIVFMDDMTNLRVVNSHQILVCSRLIILQLCETAGVRLEVGEEDFAHRVHVLKRNPASALRSSKRPKWAWQHQGVSRKSPNEISPTAEKS